ncbi:YeeE/YedE family protein [Burkholderia pseudomallei]|uniref:DUF6691 family protein n=1 Tax=Burkholderia pseudomallei TaxID=28450 RepID=UPI000F06D1CD|nr:DUF6691 family protein [Burkholderia pseudomallei]VBR03027.1 YeeE/YedE family protein [Burkholderia pseudomallei]
MSLLFAFLSGLLFGAGLLLSGMANPAKVQGFLDLAGNWDPSLAFAKRRERSLLGLPMQIPPRGAVTPRLVAGSAAFGVGWGLVGFCPGPAVVSLGLGGAKAFGFVAAMLIGMAAFECGERFRAKR